MCVVLANGRRANELIWQDRGVSGVLQGAERGDNTRLARHDRGGRRGATKLVTCTVKTRGGGRPPGGWPSGLGSSWSRRGDVSADASAGGQVLCAMGYSKAPFRPEYVSVAFESAAGGRAACAKRARRSILTRRLPSRYCSESEVTIQVDAWEGTDCATAWGCDLTYDYVKINGDYRT